MRSLAILAKLFSRDALGADLIDHFRRDNRSAARHSPAVGRLVGQRKLSLTADTYTHVLLDEWELDYAALLSQRSS